mmetsp:Transcript_22789/g.37811  ORF Transcript_22789/g.37811 Transcript_22789/m.37811 type:complete len:220 (-) Transcript_22789:1043-1702(-)
MQPVTGAMSAASRSAWASASSAAAIAIRLTRSYWCNSALRTIARASKSGISAPKRQSKPLGSKLEIGRMADCPPNSPASKASQPTPYPLRIPRPVMATPVSDTCFCGLFGAVLDNLFFSHPQDIAKIMDIFARFHHLCCQGGVKMLLSLEHDFDKVQRVDFEIGEGFGFIKLGRIHIQKFGHDGDDFLFHSGPLGCWSRCVNYSRKSGIRPDTSRLGFA